MTDSCVSSIKHQDLRDCHEDLLILGKQIKFTPITRENCPFLVDSIKLVCK